MKPRTRTRCPRPANNQSAPINAKGQHLIETPLQHGVVTDPVCQLLYSSNAFLTTVGNDVGRAKLARDHALSNQRDGSRKRYFKRIHVCVISQKEHYKRTFRVNSDE